MSNGFPGYSGFERCRKGFLPKIAFLLILLFNAGISEAAVPPPSFMPGFPLVAGQQIIFMWSPVIGAEKYRIYQDGKSVAEIASFQHILPLPEEGKHSYYVVAVDKEGKESPAGKAFEYEVRKLQPPKGVASLVRDRKIAVRWDPSEGALVYDVFRADAVEGPFQLIGSTQDVSFIDPNVEPGRKYYYRVSSKDATGTSSSQTEPVLGVVEAEKAAPEAERLKIIKTKLSWEKQKIENVSDILYLSEDSLIAVAPFSIIGPHLVVLEHTGEAKEKRTIIPLPEEQKMDRLGGMGKSGDGTVWVTGLLSPTGPTLYHVDPASKTINQVLQIEPLPKTVTPYSFIDVAEGPNGDLFVTEEANSTVMVIRKGKIVSRFGEKGREGGQFARPSNITVVGEMILVTDAVQAAINFFDLNGKFVRRLGSLGGRDPGTFSRLAGITVDREKKWILAADRATSQIQVFDLEGNFIAMLSNEKGTGGLQTNPVGLDIRNDALLVSWQAASMVQEFKLLGPPEERK